MPLVEDPAQTSAIPRKKWTRDEAHILVKLRFPNAEKLELIEGDLISRMGKNRPNVLWQHLTMAWLQAIFGTEYVQSESPIDLSSEDNDHSEPEPDLIVTTQPLKAYTSNPTPTELRLVVEVADSTKDFDLTVKAALYARSGILDYWVIDVTSKQLTVHRHPLNGAYTSITTYKSNEEVCPLASPSPFRLDRL